jgi:hypothetical protein
MPTPDSFSFRFRGRSVLPLFAHLGLVDSALGAKPALTVWDSLLTLDRDP